MLLKLALAVRQAVAGHRLGALPMHPCHASPSIVHCFVQVCHWMQHDPDFRKTVLRSWFEYRTAMLRYFEQPDLTEKLRMVEVIYAAHAFLLDLVLGPDMKHVPPPLLNSPLNDLRDSLANFEKIRKVLYN